MLEYFDAHLIGLTATPSKQTFGFFNQNLVMEYNHEQAVADGVNVNYDVYRIRTQVTEEGGRVVAMDQIRTIVRTFKEKLFTEIFPGRTEVPKTLFFAKDDSHAEDIVMVLREEFGKGNDFAQKITYRTTGASPEQLIRDFRTNYHPRIAVSVDMIATGTDIKPLEIVVFMRAVKSRNQAVAVISVFDEGILNSYLLLYLLSTDAQQQIHAEKVDVARANFSLEDTRLLKLPLPPIVEQFRIVAEVDHRLSISNKLEAQINANLKHAERLRQSVLQNTFAGSN